MAAPFVTPKHRVAQPLSADQWPPQGENRDSPASHHDARPATPPGT
jgi:hypothetical protein